MVNYSQAYLNKSIALIGYGVTGKACADFLLDKGAQVTVFDKTFISAELLSKSTLSNMLESNAKQVPFSSTNKYTLQFAPLLATTSLTHFDLVVVSPGVNLQQAFIQDYLSNQASHNDIANNKQVAPLVIGEIELFARELNDRNTRLSAGKTAPKLITITGSNGKSTIVDMLTKILLAQNKKVGLGGNFGRSALTLLDDDLDFIILELSSFQLETTHSLKSYIACVANISSDHLDRHGNMQAYADAKRRIYQAATHKVANRDDISTHPLDKSGLIYFGKQASIKSTDNGYYHNHEGIYIQSVGQSKAENTCLLFAIPKATLIPDYQLLNMQVVLACVHLVAADTAMAATTLTQYKGLAHRYETVLSSPNMFWINDSKATNPGASIAAIESLSKQVDAIVLIAGGDAKDADLTILARVIQQHVKHLVVMGKDAQKFVHIIDAYDYASNMQNAVIAANKAAQQLLQSASMQSEGKPYAIGILLAPACASIDMFANYQDRGQQFVDAVHTYAAQIDGKEVIA